MRATSTSLPLRLSDVWLELDGKPLLAGIDLTLNGGRTLLLGPNGAGKTLLLKLCHGLLTPTLGRVEWLGAGAAAPGRRHALVPQRPVLLRRSVLDNLLHALTAAGLPRSRRRARADGALMRFGLEPLAQRPARLLSGGEQQRLALARAWALEPEMIFLDEPTANLDPAATAAVEAMILSLAAEGIAVLMSSHDLFQVRRLAQRVLFLHRGRLVEDGPAGTVLDQPQDAAFAAFLRGALLY